MLGPGVGTSVGAVIGMIFGAPITAAVVVAAVKQAIRAVFKFLASDGMAPESNPEKWNMAKIKQAMDKKNHPQEPLMDTTEIQIMLRQLKAQKNHYKSDYDPFKGAVIGTYNKTEKDRYNKFLEGLKKGIDPRRGIRVDKHTRFRWDSENQQLNRENVVLPELIDGPRL